MQEISTRWDAVYESMRRTEEPDVGRLRGERDGSRRPAPFVALARQARLAEATVATKRDDRDHVALRALGVDAVIVIAHVKSAGDGVDLKGPSTKARAAHPLR